MSTETSSLLPKSTNSYTSEEEVPSSEYLKTSLKNELSIISKASAPLIVTFFLQYSLTVVSIFSVGHIGAKELAAVSLASMTFNITSSIFNGMSTSLDTFCSQAYGAKHYHQVGLYFQKCSVMIFTINIPLVLLWWNSNLLLKLIVTDPELSLLAQSYLRVMAFSTPAYILFETGKRFLQAQNVFVVGQYCLFVAAPINIFLNYFLVWDSKFGMGFLGAPVATTISYWVMCILLLTYALTSECKKCWPGLNVKKCFENWGPMMSLSLNGTLMLLSEFIAFEVLTLASARFGTETLAAQSICSTVATLCFQIPFSTSVAASTRIANLIGAGEMAAAKISTNTTYLISLVLSAFNFSLLFGFRPQIAALFTEDVQVIETAITILSVLAFNQIYDCPNVIGAGCLRAQGRQHVGSALNIIAYYVIALPLSFWLGFGLDMKVRGLWIGLGCGVFFLALAELYFIVKSPWVSIFEEAQRRNAM